MKPRILWISKLFLAYDILYRIVLPEIYKQFVGCSSCFLLFPCLNYFVWDETSENRNLCSGPVRGGQTVRKYGKSFMFQTSISWLAIEMTGQKINEK